MPFLRLHPVVRRTRGLPARFLHFRSSAPVLKYSASSSQAAISGLRWGCPSGRTVDSQYISARWRCPRASAQSTGFASGLLYRSSSSAAGIEQPFLRLLLALCLSGIFCQAVLQVHDAGTLDRPDGLELHVGAEVVEEPLAAAEEKGDDMEL